MKCHGPGGGVELGVVHLGDGLINLSISGYQGQPGVGYLSINPSQAMSPGLTLQYIEDETCRFKVENI